MAARESAEIPGPRSVDYSDGLPRDPNGKLDKREIRDQYSAPTVPLA